MMMKNGSTAACLLLALSMACAGCSDVQEAGAPAPVMPQETTAFASKGEKAAPAPKNGESAPKDEGAALSPGGGDEDTVREYYTVEAEKERNDIDREELEARLRMGTIDESAFSERMRQLEEEKMELKQKKNELKARIKTTGTARFTGDLEGADLDMLLERNQRLETQEDQLELEEERLEQDYREEKLTAEAFVERRAELERRADAVDEEKDLIEDRLEQMGWDD